MVFDWDGHIIESIPEMVPFLDPVDREVALSPSRNRQGVLVAAKEMIHDTAERPDLTLDEKAKVLGLNAKKFFRA